MKWKLRHLYGQTRKDSSQRRIEKWRETRTRRHTGNQEEKIPNGQLLESIQHHEFCPSLANFPHNTHKGPFKIYVGLGIACA